MYIFPRILAQCEMPTAYSKIWTWIIMSISCDDNDYLTCFSLSIYIYTRVNWKANRLTKILIWNVTKGGLFFNVVSLAVHTLLPSMLLCLDPTGQKVINCRYITSLWIFHPTLIYIYIYIYIETDRQKDKEREKETLYSSNEQNIMSSSSYLITVQ